MAFAPSFRDPAGFCFSFRNRIFRAVYSEFAADLVAFLASSITEDLCSSHQLVTTRILSEAEIQGLNQDSQFHRLIQNPKIACILEHERIFFPSYPHEWCPEMLHDSGLLTLHIAHHALEEGFSLKDATPLNVLFRGPNAVFVDILSFVRRSPTNYLWRPYSQFIRTFMFPLLLHRDLMIPLADLFINRRDGLCPLEVFKMCGFWRKLAPPYLQLVSFPTWMSHFKTEKSMNRLGAKPVGDPQRVRYILDSLFTHLHGSFCKLQPRSTATSQWSGYTTSHSYSDKSFAAKECFVREILGEFPPKRVLDVGSNSGHFSVLAARAGTEVVAIDSDPAVISLLFQRAKTEQLNILPLIVDLAHPTPGLGWCNSEQASFLDRVRGTFDLVLMLAVVHHLLVAARIPLRSILELLSEMTTDLAIIEFIPCEDPMFMEIIRGREHLHSDWNQKAFAEACRQHFEIVRVQPLEGSDRVLFLLRKSYDEFLRVECRLRSYEAVSASQFRDLFSPELTMSESGEQVSRSPFI